MRGFSMRPISRTPGATARPGSAADGLKRVPLHTHQLPARAEATARQVGADRGKAEKMR